MSIQKMVHRRNYGENRQFSYDERFDHCAFIQAECLSENFLTPTFVSMLQHGKNLIVIVYTNNPHALTSEIRGRRGQGDTYKGTRNEKPVHGREHADSGARGAL
jgi:hypothetical protein